jgi:hypothetical protein
MVVLVGDMGLTGKGLEAQPFINRETLTKGEA